MFNFNNFDNFYRESKSLFYQQISPLQHSTFSPSFSTSDQFHNQFLTHANCHQQPILHPTQLQPLSPLQTPFEKESFHSQTLASTTKIFVPSGFKFPKFPKPDIFRIPEIFREIFKDEKESSSSSSSSPCSSSSLSSKYEETKSHIHLPRFPPFPSPNDDDHLNCGGKMCR